MYILFSDLCEKEVINCNDGSLVGYVSDIEISSDDCRITSIIIQPKKGLFCKTDNIFIPYEKIEKIGIDVIIVNFTISQTANKCCDKPKRFFLK